MTTRPAALVLALTLGAFPAFAQETPTPPAAGSDEIPLNTLYKDLAAHNRYPAVTGLKQATADVTCDIFSQVVAAFPEAADKPVAVKFQWSRPSEDVLPKKDFRVTGVPDGLTDLTSRGDRIWQEARDFVIVDPVYWTIASTDAKAVKKDDTIVVTGTAANPGGPIKSLDVKINASDYRVERMAMDLGQAKLTIEMTSKKVGDLWGIEKEVLTYPQYRKVVTYEYTQAGQYWLPSKMSIQYLDGEGKELAPTYNFTFSNWQVS